MNFILIFYLLFTIFAEISQQQNENILTLITDKRINKLKFHYKSGKIHSTSYEYDDDNKIFDRIIWNLNLPKPFLITVFNLKDEDCNELKIEFVGKKNNNLDQVLFHTEYTNTRRFIDGSINSREMKTMSFITLNNNINKFVVSDTTNNLNLLNESIQYCLQLQEISQIVKKINFKKALKMIRTFEETYNNLSNLFKEKNIGNRFSHTICKLVIYIYLHISRLYTIENIHYDSFQFDKILNFLEQEITNEIYKLKEKYINHKDMALIEDISFFSNLKEINCIHSYFQSINDIITSSKNETSKVQDINIKSLDLNKMVTFYNCYSSLLINYCELTSKKHIENKICKVFQEEYYEMIYNNLDEIESISYDFVFFNKLKNALETYENDSQQLKLIFLCEYFLSLNISTLIFNLDKDINFYEKILERLDDKVMFEYINKIRRSLNKCRLGMGNIIELFHSLESPQKKLTIFDIINNCDMDKSFFEEQKLEFQAPMWSFTNNEYKKSFFCGLTYDDTINFIKYEDQQNLNSSNEIEKSYDKAVNIDFKQEYNFSLHKNNDYNDLISNLSKKDTLTDFFTENNNFFSKFDDDDEEEGCFFNYRLLNINLQSINDFSNFIMCRNIMNRETEKVYNEIKKSNYDELNFENMANNFLEYDEEDFLGTYSFEKQENTNKIVVDHSGLDDTFNTNLEYTFNTNLEDTFNTNLEDKFNTNLDDTFNTNLEDTIDNLNVSDTAKKRKFILNKIQKSEEGVFVKKNDKPTVIHLNFSISKSKKIVYN